MVKGRSLQVWVCALMVVVMTPVLLPLLLLFAVMNAPLTVCVLVPTIALELARICNQGGGRKW